MLTFHHNVRRKKEEKLGLAYFSQNTLLQDFISTSTIPNNQDPLIDIPKNII